MLWPIEAKFDESILLEKLFDGHRLDFYKRKNCYVDEEIGKRLANDDKWDQEGFIIFINSRETSCNSLNGENSGVAIPILMGN